MGVRETDRGPFGRIVAALDDMSDDESLLLNSSFEPKPLYEVLEDRGFEFETTNPTPDEWHVTIARTRGLDTTPVLAERPGDAGPSRAPAPPEQASLDGPVRSSDPGHDRRPAFVNRLGA